MIFETSGFEFCVSQATILSFAPFTPPVALILAASSFAAVYAGLSNGAIWPLRSAAKPITIGFFADFPPDAVVTPTMARVTATTSAEPADHAPISSYPSCCTPPLAEPSTVS